MGYLEILAHTLVPFALNTFGNGAVLVQDNAPTHRTAACRDILENSGVFWVIK
jgi:hypothetical protein